MKICFERFLTVVTLNEPKSTIWACFNIVQISTTARTALCCLGYLMLECLRLGMESEMIYDIIPLLPT